MSVDTSDAALASMVEHFKGIDGAIVAHMERLGFLGATCDDVERSLGLSHQTCSSAFHRLTKKGELKRSPVKRPTRSGRAAYVILHKNYLLFEQQHAS